MLAQEGYDAASGLILDTGGATFDAVPDAPSREDAVAALAKLKWIIEGFPFVEDDAGRSPSRSVALSALLTAVCRRSLRTAPMHGFTAPTMGTGKSLLTDAVALLAMGRPATVLNQSGDGDGEEERKRLMSVLMQSDPVVVIDNVDRPMGGARMCSILTQETWQDRMLGGNDQGHVSTRTLWLVNGNNLEFREDMSRRAILCTMDAGMERPAERKFEVDLKVEVPRRRHELVPAALTVLRAFIVAGRPGLEKLTPFGGFEDWSNLVRGALVWAGGADTARLRASRVRAVRAERARQLLCLLPCELVAQDVEPVGLLGLQRAEGCHLLKGDHPGQLRLRHGRAAHVVTSQLHSVPVAKVLEGVAIPLCYVKPLFCQWVASAPCGALDNFHKM